MNPPPGPWHFIVNPAAGGHATRTQWRLWLPALRTALPGLTFAISTPGTSLRNLTDQALAAGCRYLIGVGGDGTHHHILNALARSGRLPEVIYAPLSLGSGNDWVRSIGVPRVLDPWLAYLRTGTVRYHTVGRITCTTTGEEHVYLNVAGFAYDAEVVRRAGEKQVRNRWMYPLLAAGYLRHYQAPTVRIDTGESSRTLPVHTINVGIGKYSGGGMSFVPHADPFAARFALTYARRMSAWKILANSWRFYTGSIGRVKGVVQQHVDRVRLTAVSGRLECEADGEWLGTGDFLIDRYPDRLRLWCPPE